MFDQILTLFLSFCCHSIGKCTVPLNNSCRIHRWVPVTFYALTVPEELSLYDGVEILVDITVDSPPSHLHIDPRNIAPDKMEEVFQFHRKVNGQCVRSLPTTSTDTANNDSDRMSSSVNSKDVLPDYRQVLSECYEWMWYLGFNGHDPLFSELSFTDTNTTTTTPGAITTGSAPPSGGVASKKRVSVLATKDSDDEDESTSSSTLPPSVTPFKSGTSKSSLDVVQEDSDDDDDEDDDDSEFSAAPTTNPDGSTTNTTTKKRSGSVLVSKNMFESRKSVFDSIDDILNDDDDASDNDDDAIDSEVVGGGTGSGKLRSRTTSASSVSPTTSRPASQTISQPIETISGSNAIISSPSTSSKVDGNERDKRDDEIDEVAMSSDKLAEMMVNASTGRTRLNSNDSTERSISKEEERSISKEGERSTMEGGKKAVGFSSTATTVTTSATTSSQISVKPRVDCRYSLTWIKGHIEEMKSLIKEIEGLLPGMLERAQSDRGFRPSPLKKESEVQALPVNLHYQILGVRKHRKPLPTVGAAALACKGEREAQAKQQHVVSIVHSVTCGSLSPHMLGHKKGGLFHQEGLLVQQKDEISSIKIAFEKKIYLSLTGNSAGASVITTSGGLKRRKRVAIIPDETLNGPKELNFSLQRHLLQFESFSLNIGRRRMYAISQALSVAVNALLMKMNLVIDDKIHESYAERWLNEGFLIVFEGLLSVVCIYVLLCNV